MQAYPKSFFQIANQYKTKSKDEAAKLATYYIDLKDASKQNALTTRGMTGPTNRKPLYTKQSRQAC